MSTWEKPLPWIEMDSDGSLVVNEDVTASLQRITQPVVVIAIAGPYRTGKSYLMNILAGRPGFSLGTTVESTTKGIWVWCVPHPHKRNETVVLIDTEGLSDPCKANEQNDMSIFCLAVLLSSTFIYNSVGKIDQRMISELHFVTELTERIKVKSSQRDDEDVNLNEFTEFLPSFVLVVRDFMLELILNGKKVTPNEFFNKILTLKEGNDKKSFEYNLPRQAIRSSFKNHYCFTFTRPVRDESLFTKLANNQLSLKDLSEKFLAQSEEFCQYIFSTSSPKKLKRGTSTDGRMLSILAEEYVKTINAGAVPCIESTVTLVAQRKNNLVIEETLAEYMKVMGTLDLPVDTDIIDSKHQLASQKATDYFCAHVIFDECGEFKEKVLIKITTCFHEILHQNADVSFVKCTKLINELYNSIIGDKINKKEYAKAGGYEHYCADLAKVLDKYSAASGKGVKAEEVRANFLRDKEAERDVIMHADLGFSEKDREIEVAENAIKLAQMEAATHAQELKDEKQRTEMLKRGFKMQFMQVLQEYEKHQREKEKELDELMQKHFDEQKRLIEEGFQKKADAMTEELNRLKQARSKSVISHIAENVEKVTKMMIPQFFNYRTNRKGVSKTTKGAQSPDLFLKHYDILGPTNKFQPHHSQLPMLRPKEVVKCKATSIDPIQLRKCQKKLQQLYNKLVLQQTTFIREKKTQTFDDFDTELRTEYTDALLTLDHLFDEDKGKIPKRILIEGQPGYGKSALCAKIAYDWAHNEEYTKRFNLVFIVILQKLEHNNIEDVISNYTELRSPTTIHNTLIENGEKTLLLLDGFDELPQNNRTSILLMLYQKKYERTTVIVTCKSGMFKLSVNDRDELLKNSVQVKDFIDRHVHITGIKDKEKFLQKFLSPNHVSPVLTLLDEHFAGMTSSPLYLILLAANVLKSGYNDCSSKTEFYKLLFTCLVMRSVQKKQGKSEVFNLFHFVEPLSEYHTALSEFGKLALHKITQENLHFECNELTTKMYTLALLINDKKFYVPYHKSLVEFAAAYYVALECFKSEKISKPIADLLVQLNESSLFLPFLVGLLQKQATQLFLQMKINCYWLQANENILWTVLVECLPVYETISTLYPAVAPFIPSWIHLDSTKLEMLYSSTPFQELLKSAIKNGIISRILITNLFVFKFLSDVVLPELVIRISPGQTSDVTSYKNIHCKKVHFIFEDELENSNESEESLCQYFKLFASIRAEHYTLSLTGSPACKAFIKFLDQGGAPAMILHHINVKLNNQPEDTINKLLEKNVVLSLKLGLNTCVKQILNAVTKASSLNSISLTSLGEKAITVDLFQLTESGTREYTRLQLQNCIVTWSGTLDNVTRIRSLSLYNCQLENSIAAIQPEILHCKASQLFLQPNYNHLQELILQVDDNCCDPNIWKTLTCKNLQILGLSFDETVKGDNIKNISNWILQLPITRLILESNLEKYDPRIILINYLLEEWSKKGNREKFSVLDSVDFIFSRLVDDDDLQVANFSLALSDLLFALQKKYINGINVVCSSNIWKLILQEKFIDESKFCLSHYYYGGRDDDAELYKYNYKYMYDKLLSKLDSFCIKLRGEQNL